MLFQIWEMVKFGQCNAQQGVFSILWKDQTFSYAYFLWFEDSNVTYDSFKR